MVAQRDQKSVDSVALQNLRLVYTRDEMHIACSLLMYLPDCIQSMSRPRSPLWYENCRYNAKRLMGKRLLATKVLSHSNELLDKHKISI